VPTAASIILAVAILLAVGHVSRALLDNPRADVEGGLFWHVARLYSRVLHRVRLVAAEHIPRSRDAGPLIVIANHTSGVDPLLIQGACPFEIRWMMASNMRHPAGEFLWRFGRIIFVEPGGRELGAAREAIRHLESGGVLGIFPEGGIERPARTLQPFLGGVGLIVKKTGAPVLPFVIDGTPVAEHAWETLLRFSRARVRVMAPISYAGSSMSAAQITTDLQRRYTEWTGWPLQEQHADEGDGVNRPPA
jgi:1-acyl-sn-glycerol-3-phosphate acyltransferase